MSLAAESPVHSSSSSDDFAAALEVDLEMNNSSSSSSTSSNKSLGRDSYDAGSGEDEYADLKEATNKEGGQEADEEGQEADEEGHGRTKRCKIEDIGVTSGNYSAIVNNLPSQRECSHPGLYKGLCVNCGQPIEDDGSGVAFGYIREGLTVRPTEIQRLREIDLKNLFHKKKLILVLDLDHTLLNSTRYADISSEEDLLLRKIDPMHGDPKRSLFKLDSMHLLTKLRPYVHTFLSENGRRYLDAIAGIVTVSCGHCHPNVVDAIVNQTKLLQHATTVYLHHAIAEYAEAMASKLPGDLKVVYFVNSGTEANELAMLMARLYTGTLSMVGLRNAYHGGSTGAMGLTALNTWKYPLPQVTVTM